MNEYLHINRSAYNRLAAEYEQRIERYRKHREPELRIFEDRLRAEFKDPIHIFECGCGVGLDTLILTEHGFTVSAIDFSEAMVAYARKRAPKATIEIGEILTTNRKREYQGVILSAVLHLFPDEIVPTLLDKIKGFLVNDGYATISTTRENISSQGIAEKADYPGAERRFRRKYTEIDFKRVLEDNGFNIVEYWTHPEERPHVTWMVAVTQVRR